MEALRIKRGNPFQALITLTGLNDQPMNLTEVTVIFTVRSLTDKALTDAAALIRKVITIHSSPGTGQTYLDLSSEQTTLPPGTYIGDVRVVGSELKANTDPFLVEIEPTVTTRIVEDAFLWGLFWDTLISATVEDAEPTYVVLTFQEAEEEVTETDFTITGFTILSSSWTGPVLTLVLSEAVEFGNLLPLTFLLSGDTLNVTNNVAGEAETIALLARMTTQPTPGLKTLINKTIRDLKTAGIWAKTDKFNKWDLHTNQASLLDWKNAAFDAEIDGTDLVFTPGAGVLTHLNGHIELNLTPSIDCEFASLNDFAFSLDDLNNMTVTGSNFGAWNQAGNSYLILKTSDTSIRVSLCLNSTILRVWNNGAGINLYYCERATADTIAIYKSPTTFILGTANPSVAMVDNGIVIGGYRASNGNVSRQPINTSTFWLGSVLNLEERTAFYDIINYWKANVGSAL